MRVAIVAEKTRRVTALEINGKNPSDVDGHGARNNGKNQSDVAKESRMVTEVTDALLHGKKPSVEP